MKIRSGFVSNSSSTSFVLVGIEMPEDHQKRLESMDDPWEFIEKFTEDTGLDILFQDEYKLIGKRIASASSDGESLPDKSLSVDNIVQKITELLEKCGFKKPQLRIFTGTYAS